MREYGVREFGSEAADRLVDEIVKVFDLLLDNPLAGQAFSSAVPGIRVFSKRGYRVFYRAAEGSIQIARILHHSRDAPRHLEP